MRVRTAILLLLLLAGAAFLSGLFTMRRFGEDQFAAAIELRKSDWRKAVVHFLEGQREKLNLLIKQHDSEEADEAPQESTLRVLARNDREWAKRVWDDTTRKNLRSFDATVVWIFRADGSLFYTLANAEEERLASLPAALESVPNLFAREKPPHFYFALDAGPVDGKHRRVVEVRGLPIRLPNDSEGKTPPQGYFLAGRIWGGEMLKELPMLSDGDDVVILGSEEEIPRETSQSAMQYEEDLRDWKGSNIAKLVITNRSPALATIETQGGALFRALLIGTLALFAVLFFVLLRSIVRPLRMMINALHCEDVKRLEVMGKQKAEFGELARLIVAFFEQQVALTGEMLERIAAEKALRESEEMLRHSQKMEAVGRLAGGVAHDFNNLLTAIIGYADLLRTRLADDAASRQSADLIHQAGEQAAGLTRQLLAFSRKQLLQPRVIDLNRIVTNLHRLLQRIIGEHIEIQTAPEASPACVKADPGQIEQVIVNLGVNARDAMPRGGRLMIRTLNVELGPEAPAGELAAGAYIALEVTDTGEGMDEETRKRIFEPFFTTKGPGKGTGLGLATVYGIVRQSQGGIVVESEKGKGSTFRILLPRVDEAVEMADTVAVAAPRAAGGETILIVEDEEIVRELVCEILRADGYKVLATDRGSEAARLAGEEKGRIDLLISDVVMPEMNGGEVARCVREVAPRVRVLFVSGYSENDMADQGLEALAFQVLQKPFTPSVLAAKVREVLQGEAGGVEKSVGS